MTNSTIVEGSGAGAMYPKVTSSNAELVVAPEKLTDLATPVKETPAKSQSWYQIDPAYETMSVSRRFPVPPNSS